MKWGEEYLPLAPETMSKLRSEFERMMMVIIDEMSLIAADMFYTIHRRLVEILYLKDIFADRAVMLVGDLMQIPPVRQQQHSNIHFRLSYFCIFSIFFITFQQYSWNQANLKTRHYIILT